MNAQIPTKYTSPLLDGTQWRIFNEVDEQGCWFFPMFPGDMFAWCVPGNVCAVERWIYSDEVDNYKVLSIKMNYFNAHVFDALSGDY
jgi:hypothetical protein